MSGVTAVSGSRFILGVDASNIRAGGGVTHLQELLAAARPPMWGIDEVVVWAGERTIARLPEAPWLRKVHVPMLDRSLPWRTYWQQAVLPDVLRRSGASGLFSPGGLLPSRLPVPAVVMSQNLLPFAPRETDRYWPDWKMVVRLRLLRRAQGRAFAKAAGVIFLTEFAREAVLADMARPPAKTAVVPHGLAPRFFHPPDTARLARKATPEAPFRLLYVSIVDVYKHQEEVARAVAALRAQGRAVRLDLIGPAYAPALTSLEATLRTLDPEAAYMRYHGPVPFEQLHEAYQQADAFVFASTCETISIIVLEAMAAGLPIACSARPPMPEVLGDTGVYFDPEHPDDIARAIADLMDAPATRVQLAESAYARAGEYAWTRCADATFAFLADALGATPTNAVQDPAKG